MLSRPNSRACFHGSSLEPAETRRAIRFHCSGIWLVFLNVRTPPFHDPRVRRALNYAVDRGRVAELLGGHLTQKPTCQLLPPGIQGYVPTCRYTVNPNPADTWIAPD